MIQALLWKQWREWRWAGLAMLILCLLPGIPALLPDRWRLEDQGLTLMWALALLLPGAVAEKAIMEERAGRTEQFWRALPASRLVLNGSRCLAGMVLLLSLLMLGVALVPQAERASHAPLEFRSIWLAALSSALMIYAWTLALAARARWRGQADITAVVLLVLEFLGVFTWGVSRPGSTNPQWTLYAAPWIVPADLSTGTSEMLLLMTRAVFSLGLMLFGIARMPAALPGSPPAMLRGSGKIRRAVLGRPLAALLWKSLRETIGAAAWLLLIDAALTAVLWLVATGPFSLESPAPRFATLGLQLWKLGGAVLAVVLATRIGCDDLGAGVGDFWRSRPIRPWAYFAVRYTMGALILFLIPSTFADLWAWLLGANPQEVADILVGSIWPQLLCYAPMAVAGYFVRSRFTVGVLGTGIFLLSWLSSWPADRYSPESVAMVLAASLALTITCGTLGCALWEGWHLSCPGRSAPS